jgi:hypothetical protein
MDSFMYSMRRLSEVSGNSTFLSDPVNCSSNDSDSKNGDTGVFVTGLIIALLGSTGEQLGLTFWKLAENRIQKRRDDRRQLALELEDKVGDTDTTSTAHPDSLVVHVDGSPEHVPNNQSDISCSGHSHHQPSSQQHLPHRSDLEDPSYRSNKSSNGALTNGSELCQEMSTSPSSNIVDGAFAPSSGDGSSRLGRIRSWCVDNEAPLCAFAFALFAAGNGLVFVALGLIQAKSPDLEIAEFTWKCAPCS